MYTIFFKGVCANNSELKERKKKKDFSSSPWKD